VSVFILTPKNSGLKKYKEIAFSNLENVEASGIIQARGEDIPFLVREYLNKGKKAIGLTGEDLLLDFSLSESEERNGLKVLKTIEWKDSSAMFSKPALCLLGSKGTKLSGLPKDLTVYISSKYRNIANRYLSRFEKQGFRFSKIYLGGCAETNIVQGLADLVIDIVYTGRSVRESNLQILEKITESNFVIIGCTK
jgi:ATP phosphoribosyltransferase